MSSSSYISAEEAAKILNVPEMAIPQMVLDGILTDKGGLQFEPSEVEAVTSRSTSRYK